MARRVRHSPAKQQRGVALLVVFLIILLAGMGIFFNKLNSNSPIARDQRTAAALAQARDALIGYAASYGDTHSGQVFGFLPCPDIDNDGSAETCDQKNVTVVGRLPWKTLDLPDLRDADGECLWYAVSGSFKNNPDPDLLNWDSAGQLRVVDARSGQVLVDADDLAGNDGGAAAVIFAPGPPIAGQQRPTGNQTCSGSAANTYAAYIDSGSFPSAGSVTVKQGVRGDATVNDRLIWITPREIFKRIHQRGSDDFATMINARLKAIGIELNAKGMLPAPLNGTTFGAKRVGALPPGELAAGTLHRDWATRWNDQMRYLVCSPESQCLSVDGAPCRGALVFTGERIGGGPRTSTQKTQAETYLNGVNVAAITGNAVLLHAEGAEYSLLAPTADVVLCLP
ncbi:hypothetical protein [Rhodocyclus tenuis]|uniref:hypothetical protein n=1 Tax=Rhodocyclus tenuis TaxID=1066 RepID=UPI0019044587|nr:hypothetical protein [Rhodocyclus tenuis]MBK1680214.1 hypothetical protein [Rhodocyclus tenuis]